MVGIYKITSPTGKAYIGQSLVIEQRKRYYSYSIKPKQPKLYNSIKKHGWESHRFEVIHELPIDVSQDVLNAYEELYMSQYKECGIELLNVREAGSRGRHSNESIKKMKGKLGKWMIGRKKPREIIDKTTVKITGLKRSDESKARYSLSRLGDKNPMYGKVAANRKLSDYQVEEIRNIPVLRKYGHCAAIAKVYGVKRCTISAILTNTTRRKASC